MNVQQCEELEQESSSGLKAVFREKNIKNILRIHSAIFKKGLLIY